VQWGESHTVDRTFACAVLGVLGLIACLVSSPMAQAEPPPASAFAQLPGVANASVSPDGRHLAFLTHADDERQILVWNLATGEQTGINAAHVRVEGLFWAGDRHLIVRAGSAENLQFVRGLVDYAQLMAFDIETQDFRRLINRRASGFNPDQASVQTIDHDNGRLLVRAWSSRRTSDLFWVNVATGNYTPAVSGNTMTIGWITDASREVVGRIDRTSELDRREILVWGSGRFEALRPLSGPGQISWAFGLDASGNNLIVDLDRPGYASTLAAIPIEGGAEQILFEDARHEYEAIIMDPYTGAALGLDHVDMQARTIWFDEDLSALQQQLDDSLPDGIVRLLSWSRDRQVAVVGIEHEDRAPEYYMYYGPDRGGPELTGPLYGRPQLANARLPRRQAISYAARDGVAIPAYLTLPDGEGPHPFVVLPHGGPASRDTGGFDSFAHFLASRGYGVIQPNFRGSAGYGGGWRRAGHGGWGLGVMQNDLTDAVQAMVEEGVADPERVCIAGGSYGGYAALSGAAFTPDLYACAISINGVSNLSGMISYTRDRFGRQSDSLRYWRETMLGDSNESESSYLRARSPADNTDTITAAVLLLHGRDDSVVPAEQSRQMARSLERRGGIVRLVEQDGGDHWMTSYAARHTVMEEMIAFLDAQIGPDRSQDAITSAR
jgi:dipeptidyl aminopeptidase/acylaminoacyl peptidase